MVTLGEMEQRKVEGAFLVNLTGAIISFHTVQCEHLEYWSRTRGKEAEMIHNVGGEWEGAHGGMKEGRYGRRGKHWRKRA